MHRSIELSEEQNLVTPTAHQAMWPKPHDFIQLTFSNSPELDENITQLYLKGNSFRDIEKLLSISKTKIRDILIRLKIPIRPVFPESNRATQRIVGKKNVKPPYGFAYLEGRVVKHPKEYPTLLQIIGLWKSGQPLNSIDNIVKRIKNGHLVQNGDQYELR